MELVKYFAGSRALGNMSWNSDLDFVRVYTQSFEDIFSGVPLDTWDHYPKDLADMYEIVTFLKKLLWEGNSYLYAVMLADKKESVSDIWLKWETEIVDIARVGAIMNPFNRKPWFDRNLELISRVDDVVKRAFWCYYWVLQAKVLSEKQIFVTDMDMLLKLDNSTYASYFWDLKRESKIEYDMDYSLFMKELHHLGCQQYDHPLADAMYEDEPSLSMTKQYTSRKICFAMRTFGISGFDPDASQLPESYR